jgi:hypothetical protein
MLKYVVNITFRDDVLVEKSTEQAGILAPANLAHLLYIVT